MDPLVSVIIPVYNREYTLRRALDSVLNQSYRNLELIIVDDASTDNSLQIAKEYIKNGVRLIALSNNVGAAAARNIGMKEAKGEYIAFQDSDDEWFPDKLRIQMNYMRQVSVKVSFCPYILVLDEERMRIWPSEDKVQQIKKQGIHSILHKENVAGTPTLVMQREVIEQVGLFDETFPSIEDYDYVIRISQQFEMGFIAQPLMKVYRQEVSITTDTKAYQRGAEKLLVKHSGFLDLGYRIKGVMMFHTYDYADGFLLGLERMRESYAGGDAKKRKYLDDVLLKALGQEYITMKRVWRYDRESKILQLRGKMFAIYGAGYIGTNVYYRLKKRDIMPQIFMVSHFQEGEVQEIDGIPVREVCDVENKEMEIVVAVALETQEAILKNLREWGFHNYFILDEWEEMY